MGAPRKPVRIGRVTLVPGRPRLVGVISSRDWAGTPWAAADIIELRADLLGAGAGETARLMGEIRAETKKPLLLTIRRPEESNDPGSRPRGEAQRLALFEALAPLADAVDVEVAAPCAAAVARLARKSGRPLVGSWHDFRRTPGEAVLYEKMRRAGNLGAAVFKAACRAEKPAEVLRLANFCALFSRRHLLAVLPMGKRAAPARLFLPLAGSVLVYGALTGATAPGQADAAALRADLERFYG